MFTLDPQKLEETIQKDYDIFMSYIDQDSRSSNLHRMYDAFGQERLVEAPASSKLQFHNCFPGGYLNHVNRVVELTLKQTQIFKEAGGVVDFSKQEAIFAALHHDLGKLGSIEEAYYLDQDSDWHRKRGEMYKHNDRLQYFKAPDRGLVMLQKFGIEVTENEWLAIKLSDGIYSSGNDSYLKNDGMITSLPYIVHWADHMATRVEKSQYMASFAFV